MFPLVFVGHLGQNVVGTKLVFPGGTTPCGFVLAFDAQIIVLLGRIHFKIAKLVTIFSFGQKLG